MGNLPYSALTTRFEELFWFLGYIYKKDIQLQNNYDIRQYTQ